MLFDNPFFVREIRQHVRRPLPVQLGLLATAGSTALVLLVTLYVWRRYGDRPDPPDELLYLVIFPHFLACIFAAIYGTDRIFGDEHRRSTLEALYLLPTAHGRWLLQRLVWPLYLLLLAWSVGVPAYLIAALLKIGQPPDNFRLSLIPLVMGLITVALVLILPPDYRERMRAAQLAAGSQRRKVDVDLLLCWAVVGGTVFLGQVSLIMTVAHRFTRTAFYFTQLPLPWLWIAVLLPMLAAAGVVAMATISREELWARRALRARLAAVTVLYYVLAGLVLGLSWTALAWWVRWGPVIVYPLVMWLVLRSQARPREDALAEPEVAWAERRWANPVITRDLRSFTRFSSIRRWIVGEALVLLGIYLAVVYLFVWKNSIDLGTVTTAALSFGAFFGAVMVVADASTRPFGMWTKERTSGTLALLFMVPRSSREILKSRLITGLFYSVAAHLPLLLVTLAGLIWQVNAGPPILAPVFLVFSPVAGLFVVVLGCTVQPQTAPPWQWRREDWLEAVLAVFQIALLVVDVVVIAQWPRRPGAGIWVPAAGMFLLNAGIVYGCYQVRLRQFEALRFGEREVQER
jgi:hypothetical protein